MGIYDLVIFADEEGILLRSVTTKGNHLCSHNHKGGRPIGEEPYKILYPLGGRPTPSGHTGIDQSEERDPYLERQFPRSVTQAPLLDRTSRATLTVAPRTLTRRGILLDD